MKIKLPIAIFTSLFLIAGCNSAQPVTPTPAPAPSSTQQATQASTEQSNAAVETKELNEKTDAYTIAVKYPYTSNEKINAPINSFIQKLVGDFKKDAAPPDANSAVGPNTFDITFSIVPYNDDIVTFKYLVSAYTGGAHPNSYTATQTFNLKDGTFHTADTVFGSEEAVKQISTMSIDMLQTQLKNILQETTIDDASLEWIKTGAGPDLVNFQSFVPMKDNLVLIFNAYQVAPYAAGEQEVKLPMEKLKAVLGPPFGTGKVEIKKPLSLTPSRDASGGCEWRDFDASVLHIKLLEEHCPGQTVALKVGDSSIDEVFNSNDYVPVIEVFKKEASETPEQALENMFIKRLGPEEQKGCKVEESSQLGTKNKIYIIDATDEYHTQLEKDHPDEIISGCGSYGFTNGIQYFVFQDSNPEMFVFMRIGQDVPMFDEESIEFTK